jgi:hypothetical protein
MPGECRLPLIGYGEAFNRRSALSCVLGSRRSCPFNGVPELNRILFDESLCVRYQGHRLTDSEHRLTGPIHQQRFRVRCALVDGEQK